MKHPRKTYGVLTLIIVVGLYLASQYVIEPHRHRARDFGCKNTLRLLAFRLREIAETKGTLPKSAICDAEGRSLHSWRLLTEPYVELEKHIDLSQSWRQPANLSKLNSIYHGQYSCTECDSKTGLTQYVAVTGPGTAWSPVANQKTFRGTTLLILEWPNSDVHWGEPRDLTFNEFLERFKNGELDSPHDGTVRYVGWDCELHRIPTGTTEQEIRDLVLPSDAEITDAR